MPQTIGARVATRAASPPMRFEWSIHVWTMSGRRRRRCFATQSSPRGSGIPRFMPIVNIELFTMGMKRGIPDPRGLLCVAKHLRRLRPDIVQTWMDHSNLIGGLAARVATRAPIVWGIHHSEHV